MRKKLSLMLYLLLVEAVACYLVVVPAYAFQISSSTTGYVRVIPSSGATSMLAASRASHLATIASAASSASGQALAIRLVAGSSFIGLGVLAGLMLYELYYSSSELAQIKSEASAGAFTPVAGKVATTTTCPGSVYCSGSVDAVSIVGVGPFEGCPVSTVPSWPLFARDFPPPISERGLWTIPRTGCSFNTYAWSNSSSQNGLFSRT